MTPTPLTPEIENHGGARVIINGRRCSMNSVRRYTEYNNEIYGESESLDDAEAKARRLHHPLHWITPHGAALSGDAGYYEREAAKWANTPSIKTGDLVEFDGHVFRVEPTFNNNFKLIAA